MDILIFKIRLVTKDMISRRKRFVLTWFLIIVGIMFIVRLFWNL